MLKKNLLRTLCIMHIGITNLAYADALPTKAQQLYQLQEIAQAVNRIKPIDTYMLAVPAFIELTEQDIRHFLAGIPSGMTETRNRKKLPLSMFDFIQNLWNKVVEQARRHKKITPLMREYLIEIRAAIDNAFHHDLLNGMLRTEVRMFLERQIEQQNELIISPSRNRPLFEIKSVYPCSAQTISRNVARVLASCFSERVVQEQINLGSLDPHIDLSVIIQSMIMEDAATKQLVVSGIGCSFDMHSNIPHIVTVKSIFGDARALEKNDIHADTFYIHDGTVYPVIRRKPNRMVPDHQLMRSRLVPNPEQLQNAPTLNPQAVQAIARATNLLAEAYGRAVCMTFIKRDNTVYLIKVQAPNLTNNVSPSFFDPLYTEHIAPENKIEIIPAVPSHALVVIKKREKVILAPNVRTFVSLLNKRAKPGEVAIGIIKDMPAAQSKEAHLLDGINIPIIWSPTFERLRSWFDEQKYPLVFDLQQKIAFPFSRCRGFCTLFQAVQNGIINHPLVPQLSVLPEFMPSLNPSERELFKPDEHFPGVTLTHLFDLLKFDTQATAESALNTILFRLQKQILYEYITKKECAVSLLPFNENRCEHMERFYAYVERVAYQLHALLKRLAGTQTTYTDELERIFLVHILQAVIMQKPDEQIVDSSSFQTHDLPTPLP